MVSIALIISFLLHIITLFAIYQLLKQIQMKKETNTSEFQAILDTYLQEIKEENDRLQKAVSEGWPNEQQQPALKMDNIDPALEATNLNEKNESKDYMEASLYSRILQLYDQGLTESEIARKLNCGKTEAALIIKLYGKN